MPSYTFVCEKCKIEIDEDFSMSSCPPSIPCPSCKEPANKVITGGQGFLLGGTGWARDGYTGGSNKRWVGIKDK